MIAPAVLIDVDGVLNPSRRSSRALRRHTGIVMPGGQRDRPTDRIRRRPTRTSRRTYRSGWWVATW
jgi:hypothetical protein